MQNQKQVQYTSLHAQDLHCYWSTQANSTPPACDTLSCVLQAAREVFCNMGFKASLNAVALRAGVARQTIYNKFANKQELFSMAIESGLATVFPETTWLTDGDMQHQLEIFALHLRRKLFTPEVSRLFRLLASEASRFPVETQDFFEKAYKAPRQQLANLMQNHMDQGLLRRDDPMEAAHFFFDSVINLDFYQVYFEAPLDPGQELLHIQKRVGQFLLVYQPLPLQKTA